MEQEGFELDAVKCRELSKRKREELDDEYDKQAISAKKYFLELLRPKILEAIALGFYQCNVEFPHDHAQSIDVVMNKLGFKSTWRFINASISVCNVKWEQ